jgi:hypothetical protein
MLVRRDGPAGTICVAVLMLVRGDGPLGTICAAVLTLVRANDPPTNGSSEPPARQVSEGNFVVNGYANSISVMLG